MKLSKRQFPKATKLLDHVCELRTRFFVCLIFLIISAIITYFFYEPILAILRSPLGTPLYYNNPTGSFALVMKICLMGSLIITIPIIIYNLIMFVRPAFEELIPIKRVCSVTFFSAIMAVLGMIFAYCCIIPGTLKFFSGFQVSGLQVLMSADSYLNFVTSILITYAIIFQIPLMIVFADRIKPIPPSKMLGAEKWVILGSLIVAAIVPFAYDFMTCFFIALPIVVLYNIAIVLVISQHAKIAHKKHIEKKISARMPLSDQKSISAPNVSLGEIVTELSSNKKVSTTTTQVVGRYIMDIRRMPNHTTTATRPVE